MKILFIIDPNSKSYRFGKFLGRILLLSAGYILGKKWGAINK